MERTFKKKAAIWCAGLLVFMLVFGPALIFNTKKAEAVLLVPVGEGGPNLIANTATAANTTSLLAKETIGDGILYAAMKILIQNMTDSIVAWINSGFQGNPAFVANPGNFLVGVADQIAGNFIAGSELGFLCEPFQLDIRFALNMSYGRDFEREIGCTLSDVIGNVENFTDFTNGNFGRGGWEAWFDISQNSQNNAFGAYMVARNEMSRRIQEAVENELRKLDWGRGFLSFTDSLGNIQTPGAVIEAQLENVLGSGVRQLELADEINEIVGALIGQLVQQVFVGGLSNAGSVSSSNSSQQIHAVCQADKGVADLFEPVQWSAMVIGGQGTATYQWLGDPPLAGNIANPVTVQYTTPGIKQAQVRITRGGQTTIIDCISQVNVNP